MAQEIEVGEAVENLIHEIRGQQVMLDSDLGRLYGVETKRINEAVNRNPEKFPERFAFRITEKEYGTLKSQIATSKGGSRKGHTVFTEQGVAMLATVLKSSVAAEVSIAIMDAFVSMRHYIGNNKIRLANVETMLLEHDSEIKFLQESFQKFEEKKKVNEIYFNGQIYDAYSKILEIFNEAKQRLVVVDAYADRTVLDIVRRLGVKVVIVTTNTYLSRQDVKKYNQQYENLRVVYDGTFHDRYFILDDGTVYHCGASLNRIGHKTFSVNKIEDEWVVKMLVERVNSLLE